MYQSKDFDNSMDLSVEISEYARYFIGLEHGQGGVAIDRMLEEMPEPKTDILDDLGRMQSSGFVEMHLDDSKLPKYGLSDEAEEWVKQTLEFSEDYQDSVKYVLD